MTTFEYAVILSAVDGTVLVNSTGTSPDGNAAGAVGWEMVAVTHLDGPNTTGPFAGTTLATFKRPTGTI